MKKTWSRGTYLTCALGIFFGEQVLSYCLGMVLYPLFIETQLPILAITLIVDLISLAVLWAVMKSSHFKLEGTPEHLTNSQVLSIAVLALLTQYFGSFFGMDLASYVQDPATEAYQELFTEVDGFLLVIITVLVGPLFEEVFMRGVVFNALSRSMSVRIAAVVSAAMFMAMHLTVMHIYFAFVLGLLLAFVYWKTKSIWCAFLLHAGYNFTSILIDIPLPEICEKPVFYVPVLIIVLVLTGRYILELPSYPACITATDEATAASVLPVSPLVGIKPVDATAAAVATVKDLNPQLDDFESVPDAVLSLKESPQRDASVKDVITQNANSHGSALINDAAADGSAQEIGK